MPSSNEPTKKSVTPSTTSSAVGVTRRAQPSPELGQGAGGAQEDHAQREGQAGTQAKEDVPEERQLSKKDLEDAVQDAMFLTKKSA